MAQATRPSSNVSGHARIETRRLSRADRVRRALAARDRIAQLSLLLAVLAVWEVAGRGTSTYTFAPPSSIVPAARDLIGNGELPRAMLDSAIGLLLGFALAACVGIAIGYAMGWWRLVGRTLDPFVSALYVVPIAALVPAIIVWFGLESTARIVVIFLFAIFEIILSASAGVRNVDPLMIDVARTLGATRADLLRKVVVPATLPFVFVGLRIGASRALKGMVLAEMLFAVTGLGGLIIQYTRGFRMDRVFVVVIAIALMGVALSGVVQAVERRALRWRPEPRAGRGRPVRAMP